MGFEVDWTQVIVAALLSSATVLAATLPLIIQQRRTQKAIHDQVQNSHKTNLRDDIDIVKDAVNAVKEAAAGAKVTADDALKESREVTRRLDRISEDIGHVKDGVDEVKTRLNDHIDGR